MGQSWHIFKKDVRYLRWEIALLLALALALYWLGPGGETADAFGLLMAAAAAYTIAKLVHAEAIPGENQFWVTRPYRWSSLLIAKLAFIIVFVNFPVLVAQAAFLIRAGFPIASIAPGLLWMQVLILVCVALPFASLAALTSGLAPFAGVILVIAFLGLAEFWYQYSFGRFKNAIFATPMSMDWLRDSILFVTFAILGAVTLYLQYRFRRTLSSRIVAAGIAFLGVATFHMVPWQTLFPMQAGLSKAAANVDIQRIQYAEMTFARRGRKLRFVVPASLSNIPPGAEVQLEAYGVGLETPDGKWWALSPDNMKTIRFGNDLYLSNSETGGFGPELPEAVLSHPEQPLTLRATFYLTLFGNQRDRTFTLHRHPTYVMDGMQCFDGHLNQLECAAAFRWPRAIVSQVSGTGETPLTRLISYSPFPATLSVGPMVVRGTTYYSQEPLPEDRQVTLRVEEPIAYLRREVTVTGLHLR